MAQNVSGLWQMCSRLAHSISCEAGKAYRRDCSGHSILTPHASGGTGRVALTTLQQARETPLFPRAWMPDGRLLTGRQ